MPDVHPISEAEYEQVLPLIAAYQRFYGAEPDDDRNRAFFRRFLDPSGDGLLLGAWQDGELVGHACLYWTFSSVSAVEAVLMNDLYVSETARGGGVGKALIDAAVEVARERGADHVSWETALDNSRAQRLYERMGAERNVWFEYEIAVGPSE
jgi:GNAT superfamily N-acetyltransferase